jgi:histidinol-phosphate aminotransferase
VREHLAVVREQRDACSEALARLPYGVREVLPSHANFLAVRFDDAGAAIAPAAAGIVVRDVRRYPNLGMRCASPSARPRRMCACLTC